MRAWAYEHPSFMCALWAAIWVLIIWANPADAWTWQWFAYIALLGWWPLRRTREWYERTGGPS